MTTTLSEADFNIPEGIHIDPETVDQGPRATATLGLVGAHEKQPPLHLLRIAIGVKAGEGNGPSCPATGLGPLKPPCREPTWWPHA